MVIASTILTPFGEAVHRYDRYRSGSGQRDLSGTGFLKQANRAGSAKCIGQTL